VKAKAAQRWVKAVNKAGEFGQWIYEVIEDPQKLGRIIDGLANTEWDTTRIDLYGP
jgi:hypothetical protein